MSVNKILAVPLCNIWLEKRFWQNEKQRVKETCLIFLVPEQLLYPRQGEGKSFREKHTYMSIKELILKWGQGSNPLGTVEGITCWAKATTISWGQSVTKKGQIRGLRERVGWENEIVSDSRTCSRSNNERRGQYK
jgi:hypothetical protein